MRKITTVLSIALSLAAPAASANWHGTVTVKDLAWYDGINAARFSSLPGYCKENSKSWVGDFHVDPNLWAILNTAYAKGTKLWIGLSVSNDRCTLWAASTAKPTDLNSATKRTEPTMEFESPPDRNP